MPSGVPMKIGLNRPVVPASFQDCDERRDQQDADGPDPRGIRLHATNSRSLELLLDVLPDALEQPAELRIGAQLAGLALAVAELHVVVRRHGRGTLAEHHHAVGQNDRLGDVVRHHDHRAGELPQQREQQLLHADAGLRVERRERLVEDEQARLGHEGARERDALAHALRQLRGMPRRRIGEPDARERLGRAAAPLLRRDAADLQRELDIAERVAPRQQRVARERISRLAPPGLRRLRRRRAGVPT